MHVRIANLLVLLSALRLTGGWRLVRILSGDAGAVSVLQRIVDACANDNPEAECLSCMDDWYVACGGTVCVLRLGWHMTWVWVCTGPS